MKGAGEVLLTHQPLPMDQPTTPHALPFARTCSGKICGPLAADRRSIEDMRYLCRIQPRHGKPRSPENGRVEIHKEDRRPADVSLICAGSVLRRVREAASGETADALAYCAPVEGPASTDAVEGEDADQSRQLLHVSQLAFSLETSSHGPCK